MKIKSTTRDKLTSLRLKAISSCIEQHELPDTCDNRAVENWLNALLDIQLSQNQSDAFARARRSASLRWRDATFSSSLRLGEMIDKTILEYLKSCNWIAKSTNVLLSGKSSCGKTHIASAIGNEAILRGFKVKFFRYQELIIQLLAAQNEGHLYEVIKKLLRIDLIIIDDWTLHKLSREEQSVLFEFVEKREGQGSFVITTQFDPAVIHQALGGEAIADAIFGRIVTYSQKIHLDHEIDFREEGMKKAFNAPSKGAKSC
ncbi:ATP-binding protein [Alteromonas lipotrueae]|uniref:ATP-binding protein n=1 Tax=Alteromonas lipotrueae TaxID=2803814 RepID=UPI001C43F5A7|nr:ATP-binding protein [Alteromonas lipotrueae]